MKPRLLDLFCGAGGAAMGYHRAGFELDDPAKQKRSLEWVLASQLGEIWVDLPEFKPFPRTAQPQEASEASAKP